MKFGKLYIFTQTNCVILCTCKCQECVFIIEHVEYVIFKAILYFCKDFVRTILAILLHYQNHMYWHFKDIGIFHVVILFCAKS